MLRAKAGDMPAFDYLVAKISAPDDRLYVPHLPQPGRGWKIWRRKFFYRVFRSRAGYEASAKFTTWLYRIATNLAVNSRARYRHERPENQVSIDQPDEETGTHARRRRRSLTAEESLLRRNAWQRSEKVQSLPERQRLAVMMHKYQQMDYKQIAEVLKLSESATKSLLFRAYETLREQLKEFV